MFHLYIRVSTGEQKDNTSPADQERICRGLALTKGAGSLDIAVYRDLGVSGGIPLRDRPAGSRLMECVGKGDIIIAAKLDRMFRDAYDALGMAKEFKKSDVDLILYDMGAESVIHGTMSKAFFGIAALFAEMEKDRIAERVLGGRRAKKAAGGHVGGEAPYGFRIDGAGRAAVLVPVEAERKLLAFVAQVAGQMSVGDIACELRNRGFRDRAGSLFRPVQVRRLVAHVVNAQ